MRGPEPPDGVAARRPPALRLSALWEHSASSSAPTLWAVLEALCLQRTCRPPGGRGDLGSPPQPLWGRSWVLFRNRSSFLSGHIWKSQRTAGHWPQGWTVGMRWVATDRPMPGPLLAPNGSREGDSSEASCRGVHVSVSYVSLVCTSGSF